jgi:CHASE2 domain-containing sensor protein
MSSSLYRAAAGAELVGVVAYVAFALLSAGAAVAAWGGGWFPLCVVFTLVCGRMAGSHWRERCELIDKAKQIEEHDE